MSIVLNKDAKLKKGGRKAPKISLGDFKKRIIEEFHKTSGSPAYMSMEEFEAKPIEDIVENLVMEASVKSDLMKIDFSYDFCGELFDMYTGDIPGDELISGFFTTSTGIPLIITAGQDMSGVDVPVVFMIYWDGAKFRAYIPTKGNTFNPKTKLPVGRNSKDDTKFLKDHLTGEVSLSQVRDEIVPDPKGCIEDFESRVEVIIPEPLHPHTTEEFKIDRATGKVTEVKSTKYDPKTGKVLSEKKSVVTLDEIDKELEELKKTQELLNAKRAELTGEIDSISPDTVKELIAKYRGRCFEFEGVEEGSAYVRLESFDIVREGNIVTEVKIYGKFILYLTADSHLTQLKEDYWIEGGYLCVQGSINMDRLPYVDILNDGYDSDDDPLRKKIEDCLDSREITLEEFEGNLVNDYDMDTWVTPLEDCDDFDIKRIYKNI